MSRPTSLILGTDGDVLPLLFSIHAPNGYKIVIDVTCNTRKMWKNAEFHPTLYCDINREFMPNVVMDFGKMPIRNSTADVIVFDPPHLPSAAASKSSSKLFEKSYGITSDMSYGRDTDTVSGMFYPFLTEAFRVLKVGGVVFAKIADLVHNHKYQWQHVDFIVAAQRTGFCACDMVVKADPRQGKLNSSKWQSVKHFRKAHSYWIVLRKGLCEAK